MTAQAMNLATQRVLEDLGQSLAKLGVSQRAEDWKQSLQKLRSEAEMPRFIIGVLGDTGAGKSSVINAVLGESDVVPTNGMRACTAVVTEIAWNTSEDPLKKYSAEIEFLSQPEWLAEVTHYQRDILGPDGKVSKGDIRTPDSDAYTAYAVLQAVYPGLTHDELEQIRPHDLASRASVRAVTGSIKRIEEADCEALSGKIQAYVDSVATSDTGGEESTLTYWPLVKTVRIFLKSEVLSTGVVLVDLPGSQDSNHARSTVASKYMEQCTRLWVVADIIRAVNNKTAKTLLGQNFKQQLKLDGAFSNITFICTKTDVIRVKEAAASLGLKDTIEKMDRSIDETKSKIGDVKSELAELEHMKRHLQEQSKFLVDEIDTWQGLRKQAANGEITYEPTVSPRKRKLQKINEARKKAKVVDELSDTEDEAGDESDTPSDNDAQRELVSVEQAKIKLEQLKETKRALKEEKRNVALQIKELKESYSNLNAQRTNLKEEKSLLCIRRRNDYSRREIQNDFGFGLKELDDDLWATQNQGSQERVGDDDDNEGIDYAEIGRALPVFCVSSSGFLGLIGKDPDAKPITGLTAVEDTQIPGLQRHTLEVAEAAIGHHHKHRLNEVCRFLRGVDLFFSKEGVLATLSDAEKMEEINNLQRSLGKVHLTIAESVACCIADCREATSGVLQNLPQAASNASSRALPTAQSWRRHRDDGGISWGTYRATCRRFGVFEGSTGPRDFNEDLLQPIKATTAVPWDRAFNKQIPKLLKGAALAAEHLIQSFHENLKGRPFLAQNGEAVQQILSKNIATLKEALAQASRKRKELLKQSHRKASRKVNVLVEGSLRETYIQCAQVKGKGAFEAMYKLLETRLEAIRDTVFDEGADSVVHAVDQLITNLEATMIRDFDDAIDTMKRDYMAIIGTVADETDKKIRETFASVLESFYSDWIVALTKAEEDAAAETAARAAKLADSRSAADNADEDEEI
ncbi:Nuclear GTPase SLIP-GC [Colletotrichum sidae]|uniref:Nuclear GTPase SLIP-GC n=1 Tax=Colletotrichum sidae TaxID=1347389 RepID=A0A4R8TS61_9PEZI|nr:Nuclear GTPase SLIP-GC [Colletotrichum sidae]